jgi:hypothetical protein
MHSLSPAVLFPCGKAEMLRIAICTRQLNNRHTCTSRQRVLT